MNHRRMTLTVLMPLVSWGWIANAQQPTTNPGTKMQTQTQAQKSGGNQQAKPIADVETLMDNVAQYENQKITLKGEVKDKIDAKSFVLESGGIFNDEVVVLMGPNMKSDQGKMLADDAKVTVTGTVRAVPIVEIRRELSWDLDPQMEAELQGNRVFVVAEQIAKK